MGDWAPDAARAGVAFAIVFLTFGYLRAKPLVRALSEELLQIPISTGRLAAHMGLVVLFGILSNSLFVPGLPALKADGLTFLWISTAILAPAFAFLAIAPPRVWAKLIAGTGMLWLYSTAAAIAAMLIGALVTRLWEPTANLTFRLVRAMLSPVITNLVADPTTRIIGTRSFRVIISNQCSGLEGIGLILMFGVLWLWFFRKECRFPRALLLIPAGIGVLWLANSIRIAALILIGNAGAPGVAAGGFHSQAGWIAFNVVALGFCVVARQWSWIRLPVEQQSVQESAHEVDQANPAAAYLVPFLMLLAAGMISRATSSGFEWLYPLRFFAAAGALWYFRARYKTLDWRFGWAAPAIGVLVFGLWLALDLLVGVHGTNKIGTGLAALSEPARVAWIAFRVLAAVVTVPIAEELAFRGFLIRRIISPDFDVLDVKTYTWISLLISCVAFGLMHGDRWIAGSIAGLLYAGVMLWRGRIGDAVVAHGVTNALIAVWVLAGGNWQLW